MNIEAFRAHRQYFEMVHGVTFKAIGLLADQDLDFRPKENMRSVRELLFHIYAVEKFLAQAVQSGELTESATHEYEPEDEVGAAAAAEISTVGDMQHFATTCHEAAADALSGITETELARNVKSPYGEFTGAQFLTFINDEHWHHRGQLFTYFRLLDKKPPDLYGYYGDITE